MPRPMLNNKQKQQMNIELSAVQKTKAMSGMTKMKLDRILRKPRSKEYMELLKKLDIGGHIHNESEVNKLIDAIRAEFPEVELEGIMLGIVSKCYLGEPYEVHTLEMNGSIIEHYKKGQSLPGRLEKARAIAKNPQYAMIEVYTDCLRAITASGSVAVIDG